jgi:phage baseplate assembly protein gpV
VSRALSLLGGLAQHQAANRPMCELARVVAVIDGSDPDLTHSVDLKLKDSGLDLPKVPLASGGSGMALLPRIGDVVLVLFPRGDLSSAVAIAQVYSDQRRPPKFDKDEAVWSFPGDKPDDEEDAIELRMSVKDGRKVRIALGGSQDTSVTISDGKIEMASGDVAMTFSEPDKTLTVEVGDNKMTFSDGTGVTIEAGNKLTLKAREIVIEGDTKVKVKGAMVELN